MNLKIEKIYSGLKFAGAMCGIALGLVLALTGMTLSVVVYFKGENYHQLEIFLIFAAFALLAGAAHLLELIEAARARMFLEQSEPATETEVRDWEFL